MTCRALITGITGFIGSRLAERLLKDGWDVHALVRMSSDISTLEFANEITFQFVEDGQDLTPALTVACPDVVFHLASLYLSDHRPNQVKDLVSSNVLFPALLAEAMAATGAGRLVNTGTAWQQFGEQEYRPVNLYAATKQATEDLLKFYFDAHGLSVVTLRLFDTYGKGDKRRKLIQILIDAATRGETLAMSPGDQVVDLTHVDDVVTGFVLAANRLMSSEVPLCETFLLSGERYTVKALATLVGEAMNCPINAKFGGRSYRIREVMSPVSVGDRALPGWQRNQTLTSYAKGSRR